MSHFKKNILDSRQQLAPERTLNRKITVFGTDPVGMACAHAIANRGLATEICILDKQSSTLTGEILDIKFGAYFMDNIKIIGTYDFEKSMGSDIIIIASGVTRLHGESQAELLEQNHELILKIVPKLMIYNNNPILIVFTIPNNILTHLAWKLSGLSSSRVIGLGNILYTSRLNNMMADRLGVSPSEVSTWVIGDTGSHSIPVWSCSNVAGVRLRDKYPKIGKEGDGDNWNRLHRNAVELDDTISSSKGAACWSKAIVCATLVHDILNNTRKIRNVSTLAKGHYGIKKNVFLSLPCVVSAEGVKHVLRLPLDVEEHHKLQKAAREADVFQPGSGLRQIRY